MFRLLKLTLFAMAMAVMFLLFSGVLRQYDQESIPSLQRAIQVTAWDQKQPKQAIFSTLRQEAQRGKYQLVYVRFENVAGKQTKTVINFHSQSEQPMSFYKQATFKVLHGQAIQLEPVKGTYYTDATGRNLTKLQETLTKLGLTHQSEAPSLSRMLAGSQMFASFLPIVVSILSMLFLMMLLEKVFRTKDYAICKLNGLTIKRIILNDMCASLPFMIGSLVAMAMVALAVSSYAMNLAGISYLMRHWLLILLAMNVIFLILDLISYSVLGLIDSYAAIQGAAQSRVLMVIGYGLKAALIMMVALNTFMLIQRTSKFVQDRRTMNMWVSKGSGYTLQFAPFNEADNQEMNKLGKMTRQLVQADAGTLISRNNQEFHPRMHATEPQSGNVLIVNSVFLKHQHLFTPNNQRIKGQSSSQQVQVLVPHTRLDQVPTIKKELRAFFKFQQALPTQFPQEVQPELIVKPIKGNRQTFNYTIGKEVSDALSRDPIVVVVNEKLLSDNFYLSTASQGLVQFSNLTKLRRHIRELGLDRHLVGITSTKARLASFTADMRRQLVSLTVVAILSVSQLCLVIVFVSAAFLQNHRKEIAILKVFGRSSHQFIRHFLLANLLTDACLIVVMMGLRGQWQFALALTPYLFIEAGIILLVAWRAQRRVLATLNRGL